MSARQCASWKRKTVSRVLRVCAKNSKLYASANVEQACAPASKRYSKMRPGHCKEKGGRQMKADRQSEKARTRPSAQRVAAARGVLNKVSGTAENCWWPWAEADGGRLDVGGGLGAVNGVENCICPGQDACPRLKFAIIARLSGNGRPAAAVVPSGCIEVGTATNIGIPSSCLSRSGPCAEKIATPD